MQTPTELYPTDHPKVFRSATVLQGSSARLNFYLCDKDGKRVDITSSYQVESGEKCAVPEDGPVFENNQTPRESPRLFAKLVFRNDFFDYNEPAKIIDGIINNPKTGHVSFELTPELSERAGIFLAQIQVGINEDYVFGAYSLYINIEPNLAKQQLCGLLTIPEIRMHLRDQDPALNTLLDEYEFTETEIMHAIRKPVDLWNEALPPVAPHSPSTFPYRYNWLEATCAFLLKSAAHRLRRNILDYSAGGVTVQDQANYDRYEAIAAKMLDEYKAWTADRKTAINFSLGFSSLGGIGY